MKFNKTKYAYDNKRLTMAFTRPSTGHLTRKLPDSQNGGMAY